MQPQNISNLVFSYGISEAELLNHPVLEALPVAIYTCDLDGYIRMYNRAAVELWGREPDGSDQWCGSWKIFSMDGSPLPLDECPMAKVLKGIPVEPYREIMIQRPDGSRRIAVPHPRAITNDAGKMIGAVNMLVDVTFRKNAEEDVARLAAIVQSSEDAIVSKTLQGIVTSWNPSAEKVFGYTAAEMIGQHISKLIPSERISEEAEILSKIQRGERIEHFDTQRITKSGKLIDVSLTISPVRNSNGIIIGASKIARLISAEKKLYKALQESEQRLNIAVEAAELGTWELNLITREPSYSDRYLQILGFEPGSKPDHSSILKKIHPEDMEIRNEAIKKALEDGTLDFEMRVCPSKEIVRWIRSKGKVFYDKNGTPQRILGTTLDITDQKAAFDILLQSEERFKDIANSAPVMIWMTGNEKYAGFHNTSWLNFTGIKQEHGNIDDWTDFVHPDDVEKYINVYKEAYVKQEAFYREYRLRRYDGQYRWISDHAVPRYDNTGSFIGFISACMDIDDEKRFNEKLQASELLFKTIANVSPVALWMTDVNGKNNFVNQTWIDWTGIPVDKQYDQGWLASVEEADREHLMEVCRKSLEKKEQFAVEFRLNRKDGKVRWMLSEGGPYYSIDGKFCGLAGSVADITERKEQEIQKNDFLAVASHELKTPITSIKAYTQLLAQTFQNGDNDFVKNALSKMENQVNKMTKLVSDFLKLSKIESGKFQLNPELFDLKDLVNEMAGDIQMVSAGHKILVEKSGSLFVNADRERISQVITNFLNNAVKYSPDNKDINVRMKNSNGFVTVMVEDKGIGIKPEEHQKIFERFYRANGNANISFSGFGIGLYISAEIIRKHGGDIGVNSEEGKGSVFYFTLPQAK